MRFLDVLSNPLIILSSSGTALGRSLIAIIKTVKPLRLVWVKMLFLDSSSNPLIAWNSSGTALGSSLIAIIKPFDPLSSTLVKNNFLSCVSGELDKEWIKSANIRLHLGSSDNCFWNRINSLSVFFLKYSVYSFSSLTKLSK